LAKIRLQILGRSFRVFPKLLYQIRQGVDNSEVKCSPLK